MSGGVLVAVKVEWWGGIVGVSDGGGVMVSGRDGE